MERYIPEEIVSKIMLYNSHPIANMFKNTFQTHIDDYKEESEINESFRFVRIWKELRRLHMIES